MHYAAIVGDGEDQREVEIVEVAPGHYQIAMDGKRFDVDVRATSESSLSFLLNNHAYNIEIERKAEGDANFLVRGHVIAVEVLDLRKMRLRKVQQTTGTGTEQRTVSSPMPGKVVAVLVKNGQQVLAGDGLVVVEAMKMENELRAPCGGVVASLTVEVGATVEAHSPLCVVD